MNVDRRDHEDGESEMTLRERWQVVMRSKLEIVIITTIAVVLGIAYALLARPVFRADVLLIPAPQEEPESALLGSLSGFAALAGIGGQQANTVEALAILRSRDFTRAFIEHHQLLPVLFEEQWDVENKKWKDDDPAKLPDIQKAVRYFDENVRIVRQDKATGLVTVTVEWYDPKLAALWANDLVDRLNSLMRDRAVQEASTNVQFLEKELAEANVVTMQQSIGRVIEMQLQKLMLARGNDEYAFRVLDRAEEPKRRIWPMRTLIVILSFGAGLMIALTFVFVRDAFRSPGSVSGEAAES